MFRQLKTMLAALLIVPALGAAGADPADAAASAMTNYRVYQNDKPLKEFASVTRAIGFAKGFSYSHVEKITGRDWLWDNLPRYKIYQGSLSKSGWEYRDYAEALAAAKKMRGVHIRDLQRPGWIYETYPKYRLYQGEKTKAGWDFATLADAKKEAEKWGNAHIMELSSNGWVWDNLTAAQETKQRAGAAVYAVVGADGEPAADGKTYAYLYDAINASAEIASSEVVNTKTGTVVHSNAPAYSVLQSGKALKSFVSLAKAVQYAKLYANAEVVQDGEVLWTSVPYLSVYQGDKKLKSFHTRASAVAYAKGFAGSSVKTAEGRAIWSNAKSLVFLAWNGETTGSDVLNQAAGAQGLTIDSPTWFSLASADGTMRDTSDPSVAQAFEASGIQVMPLVHNQFDKALTTKFLADKKAQSSFIGSLVGKLAELGAYGVNLDFESVAGTDRSAFTAFVSALAKAVHAKGMKISIDLPRGDASWNAQAAYDHRALAAAVDTVVIMAYDEHWSGSTAPGSVAGLAWTEEGVRQFLENGVPRAKLMLGIPFYVREWRLDGDGKLVGNRAVYMKEVPKLIADTGATGVFDKVSGQMKYTYKKDGFTYLFWAETPETVASRIKLAKKYDLAGVAAWRLGYEAPELWTTMLRLK